MKYLKVISILTVLMMIGCDFANFDSRGKSGPGGTMVLSLNNSTSRTILPNTNMTITSFEINGTGPGGRTFQRSTTSSSVQINEIEAGSWEITVNALNAGNTMIGIGTATVIVQGSQTVTAGITVRPFEGNGNLQLSVNWGNTSIQTPSVSATLIPSTGNSISLPFTVSGSSATYSSAQIPAGYYTLLLKLLENGSPVMGSAETVRIVKDSTTTGSYNFQNINRCAGNININISQEMVEPIVVNLTGQTSQINEGENIQITANIPGGTGNVVYAWYVNGDCQASTTTNTFQVNNFVPGFYRIDVTVFSADGKRAGSASCEFTVVSQSQITLPSPLYNISCNEGTGSAISDSITNTALQGIDSTINWCRGDIKGYKNRFFIKSGTNFGNTGAVSGNLIQSSLPIYTVTFLTRITEDSSGCFIRFSNNLHFRFWNGTWDSDNGLTANINNVKRGEWVRVTYVQSQTEQFIYIDKVLSAQGVYQTQISAGAVRIGNFQNNGYFYPGEYADVRIYNVAFTQDQINTLVNSDGMSPSYANLSDGTDFGGLWKREEHGGQYNSTLTIENGRYRHWFNGDTCWDSAARIIPSGNNDLWFSADFFYPENLTANHDLGPTVQTIALYNDMGRNSPVAILLLNHNDTNNVITLGTASYRSTALGAVNYNLDGRIIEKNRTYRFEVNYRRGSSGAVAFYLDGELLYTTTGNFDLEARQVMYGLNLGIHPMLPGDTIYSDNLYSGVLRLADYLNLQ